MPTLSYLERREKIEAYFDRTAVDAWKRLTSTEPVSGIRKTVREGRDRMRATLLSWLPEELDGARILDAGCGTGALAVEAARRGAHVVAIDLSPTLVDLARERAASMELAGRIEFLSGDMLNPAHGRFDHIVCMDSLIHYQAADTVKALSGLVQRADKSVVFTFAPRTPALALMRTVGRMFPKNDRAPWIEPVSFDKLKLLIAAEPRCAGWQPSRTQRISSAFYKSQALELVRP
jgi:magnesium-protoporphyrin O-methyltransferase